MLEVIGWIGVTCFALCGIPQAIKSIKEKHSKGLSHLFLWLWFIGEVCTLIYVCPKGYIPLITNYIANMLILSVIIYYKYFPKK